MISEKLKCGKIGSFKRPLIGWKKNWGVFSSWKQHFMKPWWLRKNCRRGKKQCPRERDNILLAAKLEADKMITEAAAQVEAMQVEYRQLEQKKTDVQHEIAWTILLTELELLGQADAGGESVTDESDAEQAAE